MASALSNSASLSPLIFHPFKFFGLIRASFSWSEKIVTVSFSGGSDLCSRFPLLFTASRHHSVFCWAQICENQLSFHRHLHHSCSCSCPLSRRRRFSSPRSMKHRSDLLPSLLVIVSACLLSHPFSSRRRSAPTSFSAVT